MMTKRNLPGGLVYSTDPNVQIGAAAPTEPQAQPPPAEQNLRVRLESKQRAGKTVTLVTGFVGTTADLAALAKQLKGHCGTGGSARDGEILIQGDQREKVMQWLAKCGYAKTKRG